MKVISKFKDYYDGVQIHGFDDSVKFIRTETTCILTITELSRKFPEVHNIITKPTYWGGRGFLYFWGTGNRELVFDVAIVQFCGVLYKLLRRNQDYITSFEDFRRKYKDIKPSRFLDLIDNYFSEPKVILNQPLTLKNLIRIFIVPSIHKGELKVITNPQLFKYGFQKVVPSYQAYQQLAQVLSGVIAKPEIPDIKLTEKQHVEAKGFTKYSFRTRPRRLK